MFKGSVIVCGLLLGAAISFAASDALAFTSGDGGDSGAALEPSPPSGPASGYDYSDPRFNFSVRKNDTLPDDTESRASGEASQPHAEPQKTRGFFGRVWNGLLNMVGSGD